MTPLRDVFPEHLKARLRAEYARNPHRFEQLVNEATILRALAGLPMNVSTRRALITELVTESPGLVSVSFVPPAA
jgi:hypothetical protein